MSIVGDIFGVGGVASLAQTIITKAFPDPAERAKAELAILQAQQAGEFKQIDAMLDAARQQTDINKVEAASPSLFVAGWRPGMGWIMVTIMFSNYVAAPMLGWLAPWTGLPPPPRLDIAELYPVLLGMLGLGGMRTAERIQGVAQESLSTKGK